MLQYLRISEKFFIIILSALLITLTGQSGLGIAVEIPSSFNPVGSGARAIGMGGAFIAVADDATAASWNPGGLIQLRLPEFSIVTSGFHRQEEIDFGKHPEGAGSHSVSDLNINYLSAVYPFNIFDRNMVVSLSYQHLYDFNRDWQFTFNHNYSDGFIEDGWDYQQTGSLSAIGLSYCIQIVPQLSIGFTLNFWEDSLTDNQWEQKYHTKAIGSYSGYYFREAEKTETYLFEGFNFNIGILWRINYKLTLGAVLKTPFAADIVHKIQTDRLYDPVSENDIRNEKIEMPISYGIGIAYKFSDNLFMSADIYRTEWNNFVYRDKQGKETSPISKKNMNESEISPTHQARIGFEYRFTNPKKSCIIPIRGGLFYDPAPAEGSPDDFYGFSLGSFHWILPISTALAIIQENQCLSICNFLRM